MQRPAHPFRLAALLAAGAWVGHVVTTYVQEVNAPPLERIGRELAKLEGVPAYPEHLTMRQSAACGKAWGALTAYNQESQRKGESETARQFAHVFLREQISRRCETEEQATIRKTVPLGVNGRAPASLPATPSASASSRPL